MIPFVDLPVKIVRLFTSNVSASEVSAGVCLGLFLGFIPLNGPMAVALLIIFFVFKINRLAAMLVLPFFKLLYLLFVSKITDGLGGMLLIQAEFLTPLWNTVTRLPVLAFLDLNNTLVAGGLVLSALLSLPVYLLSKKGIVILREKYFGGIKDSKLVKWFLKVPAIGKFISLVSGGGNG